MPLAFGADIVEGKVYRNKKKKDEDDEKSALKELQLILAKKNRNPCDCGAQLHDLIENCLTCGRLTCQAEGPGKCLSCGGIVLDESQRAKLSKYIEIARTSSVPTSSNPTPSSSRTKVIDNQFDLFSIDNKKHLKESEKKMLKATLEELQAKRYQRKMMFSVDIDNSEAGLRSAPLVDDYEAELRLLQLSDNTGPAESDLTLAELVSQELKKTYAYEYIEEANLNNKNRQQPKPSSSPSTSNTSKPKNQKNSNRSKKKRVQNKEAII